MYHPSVSLVHDVESHRSLSCRDKALLLVSPIAIEIAEIFNSHHNRTCLRNRCCVTSEQCESIYVSLVGHSPRYPGHLGLPTKNVRVIFPNGACSKTRHHKRFLITSVKVASDVYMAVVARQRGSAREAWVLVEQILGQHRQCRHLRHGAPWGSMGGTRGMCMGCWFLEVSSLRKKSALETMLSSF